MDKLSCYKAIVRRNVRALILAGRAYAKPSPVPAKLYHLHLRPHPYHARDRVNGCASPMDEAGISWRMVAEEAIVTVYRPRTSALVVNDAMRRVLHRHCQPRRQPPVAAQRHRHVDTEPVIPPRHPQRERRQRSILAPDRVAIAGAR